MTKYFVSDMMCKNCVARIEKGMAEAGLDVTVTLEDKTVLVNGCEKCAAKAAEVLDDLGFTAEVK